MKILSTVLKLQSGHDFPGCLGSGMSWFNWWVSFAPDFHCCYFCESSCLFILDIILISVFLGLCACGLGVFHVNRAVV